MVRLICTANNPWNPSWIGNVQHPDAVDIGSDNDGIDEFDVYKCPHCGKIFYETVAQ